MLKRTITYENPFTGAEVTEEHYFHISKADLVTMQMEEHGETYVKDGEALEGMQAKLQRIIDAEDGRAIMAEMRDIIRRAYGKKDGDRFVKTEQNADEFMASEAFSQLLFELCTQADAAAEFMNAVMPGNLEQLAEEVSKQAELRVKGIEAQAQAKESAASAKEATEPQGTLAERIAAATTENPITLTQAEMQEIDSDELKSGIATGRIKIGMATGLPSRV